MIDKISTPQTIFCWSRDQLNILKDSSCTRIALTSLFGTGKTILLKAKAKELSLMKETVVILIADETDGNDECLLARQYMLEFKDMDNVKVENLKLKGGSRTIICFY